MFKAPCRGAPYNARLANAGVSNDDELERNAIHLAVSMKT
jgi:hypothetical protein